MNDEFDDFMSLDEYMREINDLVKNSVYQNWQRNPDVTIRDVLPHYSNPRFNRGGEHTTYLARGYKLNERGVVTGAFYNYLDRIWQGFKYEDVQNAFAAAGKEHQNNSADFFEHALRIIYNDPTVKLVHIASSVNPWSGYPTCALGTISEKNKE